MDNPHATLEILLRQDSNETGLSAADRRILLGGSIRLLRSRYASGKQILAEDLTRLAAFADDASERTP